MKYIYKVVSCNDSSMFAQGKYHTIFKDHTVVKAFDYTDGFFCFRTFQEAYEYSRTGFKIKKLIPLSKVSKLKSMASMFSEKTINSFFEYHRQYFCDQPPKGTVSCKDIFVVGDCDLTKENLTNRVKIQYKVIKHRHSVMAPGKYTVNYNKHEVSKAYPGSVGVMSFSTKKLAEIFIRDHESTTGADIVRVVPLSHAKRVKYITCGYDEDWMDDFYRGRMNGSKNIPSSTVFNDSVFVLD